MRKTASSAAFAGDRSGPWYYAAPAEEFLDDAENPRTFQRMLTDAHRRRWGVNPTDGEVVSWGRSAEVLSALLEDADLTEDQMVIFEYCLQNAGRIDAVLCGVDRQERLNAVLLELKRWQQCTIEESHGPRTVCVDFGSGFEKRSHPSVQVLRYRERLGEILARRERKGAERVRLSAYAYLHNCSPASVNIENMRRVLYDRKFRPCLHAAPLFMEEHSETLQRKIARRTKCGRGEEVLRRLGTH
ncbi:hypothetical protein HYT95_01150 [Candidatus Peregrinibacteria bacterium]|nr:hypothetical protein [Candidatus Peregrinibacteria bacterium]